MSCDTYAFPSNSVGQIAIYAGHFRWGIQSDLARSGHKYSRTHFSCLTNYRHPIDRIESCIYYRFQDKLNGACLMDMSFEQIQDILTWVDPYGQTCLNEPFRIMSGFHEDAVIDHLMDASFEGIEEVGGKSLRVRRLKQV